MIPVVRVFCEWINTFVFLSVLRVLSERNERVVKYSFNINPVRPVNPVKKYIDELLLPDHPAYSKHNQNG